MRFSHSSSLCALLLGLGLTLGSAPAQAGAAQDRIFATGVLDGIAAEEQLIYRHDRQVGFTDERLRALENGRATLTIEQSDTGAREARLVLTEDERERRLNPFPGSGGNPLMMVFMENAVQNMAGLTGGNAYYIRNRMREALSTQDHRAEVRLTYDGAEITAERMQFRPFAEDPNRERMGAFGELELQVVVSPDVPGYFAQFSLATGATPEGEPLLVENMTLEGVHWLE